MGGTVDVGWLAARDVKVLGEHLTEFMKPYVAVVGWSSREKQLEAFIAGLLGGTERKSVEPMALAQGVDRRQLQHVVGVSPWNHGPLLGRLQAEVGEGLGDPEGVLVVDGSATPKKGTESVGVARQWCGRLGKVENCQVGIYLAYAGQGSCALVDERLYLPRAWAKDPARRTKAKVPGHGGVPEALGPRRRDAACIRSVNRVPDSPSVRWYSLRHGTRGTRGLGEANRAVA